MGKDLKDERLKVLGLLQKGLISADEAEKLLSAMDHKDADFKETFVVPSAKKAPFRMLRIYVDSKDGDVVKIQIPIEFAKLLKSGKFNVNLEQNDIDIDSIIDMINQGFVGELVNVESADGDIVKIVVE
jgi:hypothetical protein